MRDRKDAGTSGKVPARSARTIGILTTILMVIQKAISNYSLEQESNIVAKCQRAIRLRLETASDY